MTDEPLREIQLNGKQLVFVFMAATVVAVVIFLSGVMVGRTAPQRVVLAASAEDTATGMMAATPDETLSPLVVPAPTEGPVAVGEELEYPRYLEGAPPPETLEAPPVETIAEPVLDLPAQAPSAPLVPAAGATVADADILPVVPADDAADLISAPPGDPGGWVVQVAAVSERPAAEAIASDLSGKGYAAFVTTPGPDAPLVFRVRVGAFPDRRAAETAAGRLEREEQFRPWVTR